MEYMESVTGFKKFSQYWMHELEPGLLIFFTSSTKEGYEKTMNKLIRRTQGLHEIFGYSRIDEWHFFAAVERSELSYAKNFGNHA